jgi:AraC-like DNA-binding protein
MLLELIVRTAGACVLLVSAAILLVSAPRSAVSKAFLPFALGLSGFLAVNTAFEATEPTEPLWSIASFFSRMAVVFVWTFCLVLFDGRLRVPRAAFAVGIAWLVLVVIDKNYFAPAPASLDISAILIVFGTGLLLHAGWRVLRELRDDLIESRRRARPFIALALLAMIAMDFGVDVLKGYGWQPAAFLLLQDAIILAIGLGLALWLLRADPWMTAAAREPVARPAGVRLPSAATLSSSQAPVDPNAAVIARVESVMRADRTYLDPDLTFAAFAERVGVPEPALRRAINHGLGHGHFRNFVNEYRIEEAKRRLADPAEAGQKIVAIALESGFASLASFNRAFKQAVGMSPSEYRADAGSRRPATPP